MLLLLVLLVLACAACARHCLLCQAWAHRTLQRPSLLSSSLAPFSSFLDPLEAHTPREWSLHLPLYAPLIHSSIFSSCKTRTVSENDSKIFETGIVPHWAVLLKILKVGGMGTKNWWLEGKKYEIPFFFYWTVLLKILKVERRGPEILMIRRKAKNYETCIVCHWTVLLKLLKVRRIDPEKLMIPGTKKITKDVLIDNGQFYWSSSK